jgi:hypothetical protein
MASDSYRLMRYRLVESIVALSFEADELVAYSHARNVDLNETVAVFVDWTYDYLPGMVAEGLVPPELADKLRVLSDQSLAALRSAPTEPCETAVLYHEWSVVRATASSVLERFRELGVPIPPPGATLLGDMSTVPASER